MAERKAAIKPQMREKVELMKLAFEILKTQDQGGKVSSDGVVLVYKKLYGELGSLVEVDVQDDGVLIKL